MWLASVFSFQIKDLHQKQITNVSLDYHIDLPETGWAFIRISYTDTLC